MTKCSLIYLIMLLELYRSNGRIIVNEELERIWKERLMAFVKVSSHSLPGKNEEENHKNLCQDSWLQCWELIQELSNKRHQCKLLSCGVHCSGTCL